MKPHALFYPLVLCALLLQLQAASSKIKTETILYQEGDVELEGYLAYDDSSDAQRPAIVVFHDWLGVQDYAKSRAEQLAELGYIAFAADIYGKGVRPQGPEEAGEQATKYKNDRPLLRKRTLAGLDYLKAHPLCQVANIAAIGYCFGGTTVLELARSGADIKGVVSFHGGLDSPTPEDAKNIVAKVLALHGADDPYVKEDEVAAFRKEMTQGGVDWQLVYFGGAVHSFSKPSSGSDKSTGAAYDASADKRSWEMMKSFFSELFE